MTDDELDVWYADADRANTGVVFADRAQDRIRILIRLVRLARREGQYWRNRALNAEREVRGD